MDQQRVVRIRRAAADGPGPGYRVGSGYLIGPGRVLTAAHVLIPADYPDDRVEAANHGDPCEIATWTALENAAGHSEIRWDAGTVEALDAALDIAVVAVPGVGAALPPVPLGRLEGNEPIHWKAVGFPLAAKDDAGRQPEHAWGHVSPITGAFEGRLGMTIDSRHARPTPAGGSGWSGLSGAAVFCDQFLVGIVVADPLGYVDGLRGVRIEQATHVAPELAGPTVALPGPVRKHAQDFLEAIRKLNTVHAEAAIQIEIQVLTDEWKAWQSHGQ